MHTREALLALALTLALGGAWAVTPGLTGTNCQCLFQQTYTTSDATGATTTDSMLVQAQCSRHELYEGAYNCTCFDLLHADCTHHPTTVILENKTQIEASPAVQAALGMATTPGVAVTTGNFDDTDLVCSGCDGGSGIHDYDETVHVNHTIGVRGHTGWEFSYFTEAYDMPCVGTDPCAGSPVNCVTAYNGTFGNCSHECGGGIQVVPLVVVTPPQNGGIACPNPLVATNQCNLQSCPVDCGVGEYGNFSACSLTCKDAGGAAPQTGNQTRARVVVTPPSGGGAACPDLVEYQTCTPPDCAVSGQDCVTVTVVTTPCDAACDEAGVVTSTIAVVTEATGDGVPCPPVGERTVFTPCTGDPCPDIDCLTSTGSFGACSVTCGGGVQTAPLTVVRMASGNGTPCPDPLSVTQACSPEVCPVDCVVSAYGNFSTCSLPCRAGDGSGTQSGVQSRSRVVVTPASGGGSECPLLVDSRVCVPEVCGLNNGTGDVDCVTALAETTACTGVCEGTGTRVETVSVVTPAAGNGVPCPSGASMEVESPCVGGVCHCDGSYSEYSVCVAPGTQTRTFNVTQAPSINGDACPAATDTRACEVDDGTSPASGGLNTAEIAAIATAAGVALVAGGGYAIYKAFYPRGYEAAADGLNW